MKHYNIEYVNWNGRLFIVKDKFEEVRIKPHADLDALKKWTGSTTLLRRDGYLWCCEEIEDAEIISESSEK